MKVAVDLHIHTALSPCANNDMTPNNIVNMAILKGLDIIAITDHNSVENFQAVSKCVRGRNLLVIPGMEIETKEEIHLICLFPNYSMALKMQDVVYSSLPDIDNREDIFGKQVILDENDNITGFIKRLLITATSLSIEEVFDFVRKFEGVVIPAHVDRDSYSIVTTLGFIPENLNISYIEISKSCDLHEFLRLNRRAEGYKNIKSSDAHNLGDLLERESLIELDAMTEESLVKALS